MNERVRSTPDRSTRAGSYSGTPAWTRVSSGPQSASVREVAALVGELVSEVQVDQRPHLGREVAPRLFRHRHDDTGVGVDRSVVGDDALARRRAVVRDGRADAESDRREVGSYARNGGEIGVGQRMQSHRLTLLLGEDGRAEVVEAVGLAELAAALLEQRQVVVLPDAVA